MLTEADTCRTDVVPRLQAAGWDDDPHSIAEQRTITDGRIVPVGKGFVRKAPKRVDYLLRYTRDFPLAVVEAKAAYRSALDGLQQAKQYAEMLGLKFAYATNGKEIVEFDYFTGRETLCSTYPTPAALWNRYRSGSYIKDQQAADRLLTPFNHEVRQGERYYQQIAVNRTVEAILNGQRRLLLTMASGTGKTAVAFQICWKLWNARWNRTGDQRRPRILYLADRNILVDQPKDGIFAAFGDARCKIESGEVVKSREMYFAIYQALAEDERREGVFKSFPQPTFVYRFFSFRKAEFTARMIPSRSSAGQRLAALGHTDSVYRRIGGEDFGSWGAVRTPIPVIGRCDRTTPRPVHLTAWHKLCYSFEIYYSALRAVL